MTKKLLLADDSVTIQKVISIIFATEDYELQVCDDGNEAFEKALAEYPDLVIADVVMPGKDGFELCQAIKSEPRLEHTSVLLLPGTFEHFEENRAEEVGADGWLNKPFESQALLDKVAQLLAAEPVRLTAAGGAATAAVSAVEETVEEMAEQVVEKVVKPLEEVVDDVTLGLDEVEKPEAAQQEAPPAEGSADDIWDAVSFEEEDLQQGDDLSAAVDTDLTEEFAAAGETDEVLEEMVEEPIELVEEVGSEPEEDLIEPQEEAVELEPAVEETVPVVELQPEEVLEDEDEVLDLGEGDILEEEPLEELVEAEPEFAGNVNDEIVLAEEPVAEVAPEPELTPEAEHLVAESAAASSVAQAEQQLRELSDDDLKEVVARVAAPTIEKLANEMLEQIVWEVVPDLAESMIREEIRKIRQGAE